MISDAIHWLIQPITAILSAILCFIGNVAAHIANGIITALNYGILGIADLIEGAVALLPEMPDMPSVPDQMTTAASWFAWVFPVETMVELFGILIVGWLAWQLVVILMRWVKATDS